MKALKETLKGIAIILFIIFIFAVAVFGFLAEMGVRWIF